MRFSLTFRIAAAFIVSLISLVALATISYRNVAALNRDAECVIHTYEVLETKERVERTLEDTLEKTCAAFPCTVEVTDLGERVELATADDSVEIKDGKVTVTNGEAGEAAPAPAAPAPKPARGKHR